MSHQTLSTEKNTRVMQFKTKRGQESLAKAKEILGLKKHHLQISHY